MKKVSKILLSLFILVSCFGCNNSTTTNVNKLYTAGTYSASAAGRNGNVTLTVTFSDSKIESIERDHEETSGIGDIAIDTLINETIENQTIPDSQSGATVSSKAFIEALKDTIEQAGGDVSNLLVSDSNEQQTIEYQTQADLIVVGAGAAGMSASIIASQNGLSVILLEKSNVTGGNTPAAANGINAADSKVQLENETYVSLGASKAGLKEVQMQNDHVHENLVDAFVENSGAVIDWFSDDMDVEFEPEFSEDDRNTVQNNYMLQARSDGSTGITMINALNKQLEQSEVLLYKNVEATSLMMDGDDVVGVVATGENGQQVEFKGSNVLLATGGFGHNQELIAKYNPDLANCTTDEIAPTTGQGLEMALAIGAKAVDLGEIQTFPVVVEGYGMLTPNKLPGGFQVSAVIVNDNAQRFCAEGFEIGDSILKQPNGNAYMIFTEEQLNDNLQTLVDGGYIVSGEDAGELAQQLGLDENALTQTIEAYNKDIADGVDDEFGKENPIQLTGTLYGFKYGVGAHFFMGGLLINEDTQVLDENEQPINGLYAAGEVTGGFHGTQRIDGSGLGDSFVFGWIAGNKISQVTNIQ